VFFEIWLHRQRYFSVFLKHFDIHREKVANQSCLLILDGHTSHVSLQAVPFAKSHNIELICLPPLDTHINKKIKMEWLKNLIMFLHHNEKTILTRDGFAEVFSETWKSVVTDRGLALNAFSYCGFYPLRNTITEEEYTKSNIYDTSSTFTSCVDKDVLLYRICESPKEQPNPTHHKPHMQLLKKAFNSVTVERLNSLLRPHQRARGSHHQAKSALNQKNIVQISEKEIICVVCVYLHG
jgi:hypothetical protein